MKFFDPACDLVCDQWKSSRTWFSLYPKDKLIQLSLVNHSQVASSVNLTIHRGICNHSCLGKTEQNCSTTKHNLTWRNVNTPITFENCTSSQYYCVTAITEDGCCRWSTDTIFLEDAGFEVHAVDHGLSWSISSAVLLILVALVVFGVISRKYFFTGDPLQFQAGCEDATYSKPLQPRGEDTEETSSCRQRVVFLYSEEKDQSFLENVNALQCIVRTRVPQVNSLYTEEDEIMMNVHQWVHQVVQDEHTKVVLLDTDATRRLWWSQTGSAEGRSLLDRTLVYTLETVRSMHLHTGRIHKKLFVVRLKGRPTYNEDRIIFLENGTRYEFPGQESQLLRDLLDD